MYTIQNPFDYICIFTVYTTYFTTIFIPNEKQLKVADLLTWQFIYTVYANINDLLCDFYSLQKDISQTNAKFIRVAKWYDMLLHAMLW